MKDVVCRVGAGVLAPILAGIILLLVGLFVVGVQYLVDSHHWFGYVLLAIIALMVAAWLVLVSIPIYTGLVGECRKYHDRH